ncbi:hypothetical protein DPMN_114538 [Dreissena polymorpha]|uniref:Uncharacterized protein n=1 Tax=Dreissena polymorpha TaxID=45954 RepID=A0A9D4QRN0_DREPO|nr:hypothetical protein DPMN_114538 [Dreissena polymorpha]
MLSADLVSGRPYSPAISILVPGNEPLVREAYEIPLSGIPTSVSAGYMQSEVGIGSGTGDL